MGSSGCRTYSVSSEAAIQPSGLSIPTCTQPFARPNTINFSPEPATRTTVAEVLGPVRILDGVLIVTTGRLGVAGWTVVVDGPRTAPCASGSRLSVKPVVGTDGTSGFDRFGPAEVMEPTWTAYVATIAPPAISAAAPARSFRWGERCMGGDSGTTTSSLSGVPVLPKRIKSPTPSGTCLRRRSCTAVENG